MGELGLTDGVAVWLDEGRVDFVARERLDATRLQLVRVDLAGLGQVADLNVRLVRVVRGAETPFRKGWFHSGTWEPLEGRDRDTVDNFLERSDVVSRSAAVSRSGAVSGTSLLGSQTLTTLASQTASQLGRTDQTGSQRSRNDNTSWKRSSDEESGERARVRRSMRRARKRMAREREAASRQAAAETRASGGPGERRAAQPTPPAASPGTRRTTLEGLRKGISPADIVTPILSAVGGTSLMASYSFSPALERSVNIGESWFRMVMSRVPGLTAHQAVQLVIQLPDGSFVQSPAKVLRVGPDRMLLESAHADPMTLAVLRRSI